MIANNEDEWRKIMMYVAQCHERYPYNQHEKNGHNYHLSSICAGIDYG